MCVAGPHITIIVVTAGTIAMDPVATNEGFKTSNYDLISIETDYV